MSQSRSPMTGTRPTSKRDVAAAVEYLATAPHAPGMVEVYNDAGDKTVADVGGGVCPCRDSQYRRGMPGEDGCKPARRVARGRGDRPLPPIPMTRVDPLLLRARSQLEVER